MVEWSPEMSEDATYFWFSNAVWRSEALGQLGQWAVGQSGTRRSPAVAEGGRAVELCGSGPCPHVPLQPPSIPHVYGRPAVLWSQPFF